ncbi:hypothetical protein Agub_g5172, partial [Astrephomene gubernaculifera]
DDPMERLKPGVRQMLAASHAPRRPGLEDAAAQGGGVATMMAEVRERDPAAAAAEAVAGGRALDKLTAAGGGGGTAAAAATAVEGYVPGSGKRGTQQAVAVEAAVKPVNGSSNSSASAVPVVAEAGPSGSEAATGRPATTAATGTAAGTAGTATSSGSVAGVAAGPQPVLKSSLKKKAAGAPLGAKAVAGRAVPEAAAAKPAPAVESVAAAPAAAEAPARAAAAAASAVDGTKVGGPSEAEDEEAGRIKEKEKRRVTFGTKV